MARAKAGQQAEHAPALAAQQPAPHRRREHAGGDQQEADRAVRRHWRGTADAREVDLAKQVAEDRQQREHAQRQRQHVHRHRAAAAAHQPQADAGQAVAQRAQGRHPSRVRPGVDAGLFAQQQAVDAEIQAGGDLDQRGQAQPEYDRRHPGAGPRLPERVQAQADGAQAEQQRRHRLHADQSGQDAGQGDDIEQPASQDRQGEQQRAAGQQAGDTRSQPAVGRSGRCQVHARP
jgi:hypothetical protein